MAEKSGLAAKPTNQKEIVPSLKKEKPQTYRYVEKEEPESSSISSYGRGRISSVPQVE